MSSIGKLCEDFYYLLVDGFDGFKAHTKKTKDTFKDTVEKLFKVSVLTANPYLDRNEVDVIERWARKIRVKAGDWYDLNVKKKKEDNDDDEDE